MRGLTVFLLLLIPLVILGSVLAMWTQQKRAGLVTESAGEARFLDLAAAEIPARGWWWGLLSTLLPIAGSALLLGWHWRDLPARFPIHWGLAGQPDRWANRSVGTVFGGLLFAFVLVIFLGVLGDLVARSSPGYEGRPVMIRTMRTTLVLSAWLVAGLSCTFSILPLIRNGDRPIAGLSIAALLFSLGIILYLSVQALRLRRVLRAGQASTEARHWKAGVFYFNPSDSALLVPKRLGFGYTFNFGRPVSWLLLTLILLLPLLPLLLFRRH